MGQSVSNKKTIWGFGFIRYAIPAFIGLIFIWLSTQYPSNPDRSLLLSLSITIPEVLIWTLASVAAFRFKQYAYPIKEHEDGKGLNYIANALLWLVAYIIVLTTASTVVNILASTPYRDIAIGLRTHLPIAVALVSVYFLYNGSKYLCEIVGNGVWTRPRMLFLNLSALIFLAVFGSVFYSSQPNSLVVNGVPRFALPVQALIFTYVLPHVVLWLFGIKACVNIAHYASKVSGSIYKSLFKDLYRGTLLVFTCIFIAQFLIITSISITNFNLALPIIYGVLILSTMGFVLVLRGSKKLDKLER